MQYSMANLKQSDDTLQVNALMLPFIIYQNILLRYVCMFIINAVRVCVQQQHRLFEDAIKVKTKTFWN